MSGIRAVRARVVTIKEAARILGVSEPTLRRWDSVGKFKAHRHPMNGYRLYNLRRVLALRAELERAAS